MLRNCNFLESLKAEILKLSEDDQMVLGYFVALQEYVNDILFSLPENPRTVHRNHLTVLEGGNLDR
ncbi:hypothetical protein [Vibrio vulnificus]|uniref:hypothetical protein n=1 Tax=Vibrio vulnificus TaxID=672 RepID=UPI0005F1062C|nr:hypothetical protein [Vibrio vulnificus]HAT8545961.1 hypothetical protein [Vibrio vulnificus]HDZ3715741.1 hypothetical protein [Vibrio vulnificus]